MTGWSSVAGAGARERWPRVRKAARAAAATAAAATAVLAVLLVLAAPASAATRYPGVGTKPWVIALCNFTDQRIAPESAAYYRRLFSDAGAGELNLLDYWRDVSYGQFSISGTIVVDWVQAKHPETGRALSRREWIELDRPYGREGAGPRLNKIVACANGVTGVDWSRYWGVAAVFPEVRSRTARLVTATDTTIELTTTANFPDGTQSFPMAIGAETVLVTRVDGTTLTVTRAHGGTTRAEHAAGTAVGVAGDLGGVGHGQLGGIPVEGGPRDLGTIILPHNIDIAGAAHEMGHGIGWDHSRKLSTSTHHYNDPWDLMSVYGATSFTARPGLPETRPDSGTNFGGEGLYANVLGTPGAKGPGLDAIHLDKQGWIPDARHFRFDNSAPRQATVTLHALSDRDALSAPADHYLEARVPAAVTIQNAAPKPRDGDVPPPTDPPTCTGTGFACTTSQYYSLEYREPTGWDRGFDRRSVQVRLHGRDEISYLVDRVGSDGRLEPGGELVDAANNAFVGVNAMDTGARTATVTIGSRQIATRVQWLGDTEGDFQDVARLRARLQVDGSGAPVPRKELTLALGGEACTAFTDRSGVASCTVRIFDHPGTSRARASFAGSPAYRGSSVEQPFAVTREATHVRYTGPVAGDHGDTVGVSARLSEEDGVLLAGKRVEFRIGTAPADTCAATTDDGGLATCAITLTQDAAVTQIRAAFPGDGDYEPSRDERPFEVRRERTTLSYTGATTADYNDAATASAVLREEDGDALAGRAVEFRLGSSTADTCTATTDASGAARCDITPTQPAGTYPMRASFAGETNYLPAEADTPFVVTRQQTTTAYTGPTVLLRGGTATLDGRLLEEGDPARPVAGRALTLAVGAEECRATTDVRGIATCTVTVAGALGEQPVGARFEGDAYYLPSDDSRRATVFAFPSRGAFVLGDRTVAAAGPSTTVTWWADSWSRRNELSGGSAPASFKGFAGTVTLPTTTPATGCGGAWVTRPGSSPPPTDDVPSHMGVLVASGVDKLGAAISGDTTKIVVVLTDPGYAPTPEAAGTGKVVATYCG